MSEDSTKSSQSTGFLSKAGIESLCKIDPPLIQGRDPNTPVEGWSYDMRLGNEVFLSSEDKVRNLGPNEAFFILPGNFALLTTEEKLNIPSHIVAFITLRFSVALKGLVNVSGFHVDPNFRGRIVFSVYNAGPNAVALRQGERMFMVCFAHLDEAVPLDSRENSTFKNIERLKSEWISAAKGPSVSLVALNAKVEGLKTRVDIFLEVLGVIVATVLGGVLLAYLLGIKP